MKAILRFQFKQQHWRLWAFTVFLLAGFMYLSLRPGIVSSEASGWPQTKAERITAQKNVEKVMSTELKRGMQQGYAEMDSYARARADSFKDSPEWRSTIRELQSEMAHHNYAAFNATILSAYKSSDLADRGVLVYFNLQNRDRLNVLKAFVKRHVNATPALDVQDAIVALVYATGADSQSVDEGADRILLPILSMIALLLFSAFSRSKRNETDSLEEISPVRIHTIFFGTAIPPFLQIGVTLILGTALALLGLISLDHIPLGEPFYAVSQKTSSGVHIVYALQWGGILLLYFLVWTLLLTSGAYLLSRFTSNRILGDTILLCVIWGRALNLVYLLPKMIRPFLPSSLTNFMGIYYGRGDFHNIEYVHSLSLILAEALTLYGITMLVSLQQHRQGHS